MAHSMDQSNGVMEPFVSAKTVEVGAYLENDWLYIGRGKHFLKLSTKCGTDTSVVVSVNLVTDLSLMENTKDTVLSFSQKTDLVAGKETIVPVSLKGLAPGFYQVRIKVDGTEHSPFNIGVDPEKIQSPQDRQPDFDEFWRSNLEQLAKVPMEPTLTLMPEQSTPERNVYRVEMKSLDGVTIGGILARPTKEGKYPTYIEYMGYGADVYPYWGGSNPDRIEFLVSVRDQGIFRTQKEGRWIDRGISSKETFYYKGAFCDVIRAIDFVTSLPQCDTERLFAMGESQGGAFTWIAASLDHRVKAIAPAVPFLGDYQDYSRIVWWPMWEVFEQAKVEGIAKEDLFRMLSYFDVKNFTDKVECPVYMSFGLQDPTCPPHTNFSEYNQVKGNKRYYCAPLCGHGMWEVKEWQEKREEFFTNILY